MKTFLPTLFSLTLTVYSMHAISYPMSPTDPVDPGGSTTSKKSGTETAAVTRQQVKAFLGSGDYIIGEISMPQSLKFRHYKSGLVYRKTVSYNDIYSIRVLEYKRAVVKKMKARTVYEFRPSRIEVALKNGRKYEVSFLFKFLKNFEIDTIDGTTTLFAFFRDAFSKKKGWSEVESRDPAYHKNRAHPRSVVKVVFHFSKPSGVD